MFSPRRPSTHPRIWQESQKRVSPRQFPKSASCLASSFHSPCGSPATRSAGTDTNNTESPWPTNVTAGAGYVNIQEGWSNGRCSTSALSHRNVDGVARPGSALGAEAITQPYVQPPNALLQTNRVRVAADREVLRAAVLTLVPDLLVYRIQPSVTAGWVGLHLQVLVTGNAAVSVEPSDAIRVVGPIHGILPAHPPLVGHVGHVDIGNPASVGVPGTVLCAEPRHGLPDGGEDHVHRVRRGSEVSGEPPRRLGRFGNVNWPHFGRNRRVIWPHPERPSRSFLATRQELRR